MATAFWLARLAGDGASAADRVCESGLPRDGTRKPRGGPIFADDLDRKTWLHTLGQACEKTGWRIHAWVLMSNHYHLLVETPEANLVAGMKWLQGTYTQRYNSRHSVFGHVFQGRYKALVVDGAAGNYFGVVSTYIHLNPARAGLVSAGGAGVELASQPKHSGCQ